MLTIIMIFVQRKHPETIHYIETSRGRRIVGHSPRVPSYSAKHLCSEEVHPVGCGRTDSSKRSKVAKTLVWSSAHSKIMSGALYGYGCENISALTSELDMLLV